LPGENPGDAGSASILSLRQDGMIALSAAALLLYAFVLWRTNRCGFIFSPAAVHLGYLALYVVVPAVSLYAYDAPHSFNGRSYFISARALSSILLALLGFSTGTLITGRGNRPQAALNPDLYRQSFTPFLLLASVLTLVFVVKNLSFMESLNSFQAIGDPDHYAVVQELKADATAGSNYLLQGVHHIIPFLALLFLTKFYCGEKKFGPWAAALVIFDFAFELASGGLWVALSCPLMVLMARQYFRPATYKQVLGVGTVLVVLVGGLFIVKFGSSSLQTDDQDNVQLLGMVGQRMTSGAGTIQLILEKYPQTTDYEYGMTYVHDAISLIPSPIKRNFVPESWWGGFNGFISYSNGYYKATAQVPVMAEFYANFGMMGVLFGSVLYGMVLQRLSNGLRLRCFKKASTVIWFVVLGYRLAEATVEGIGGRFSVSCLWLAIFFAYCE
jgi:oligosaccharide repeat unit polymerase